MKKILLIAVAFILTIPVIFLFYRNTIIERAVEHYGSQALNTEVSLGGVNLALDASSASFDNIQIHNPEGFSKKSLLALDAFNVALTRDSLVTEVIQIDTIALDGLKIRYELGKNGSNINYLKQNIDKQNEAPSSSKNSNESESESKRIHIKTLRIQNSTAIFAFTLGGKLVEKEAPLPEITLRDLGNQKQGLSTKELAKRIITRLNTELVKVKPSIAGNVTREIKNKAEELGGKLKGLIK